MSKVLLAVDGSECSARAAQWVIDSVKSMKVPAHVHLVTVQPAIVSGEVRRFVGKEAIEGYQREEGEKALGPVRTQLEKAGIAFTPHILIGHVAESIVESAVQQGCSDIVMGTRGMGGVKGLILGSVASQVIHLSAAPITLVK